MRSGGFRGLSESLDFAASLVDKYGTQLFPLDEDDELYALGFLDKLNQSSSLMDGMGRIPYRKGSKVGYSSKIIARHLESLDGSRRSELQETGLLMYDEIEEEVAQASLEVKQEFAASIAQAIESAKRLDQALANKSGSSGFGFGNVLKEITTIQDWFSELAGDLAENGGSSDSGEDAKSGGADNDSSGHVEPESAASKGTVTKPGTIQNREDALASLVRVASFFRKTEPHSPVSYALEQAVRWGKMPLPELLMDLVQNTDVRGEVFRRLGIIEKSNEDTD
jgi:type VI secretion system protein ImpA